MRSKVLLLLVAVVLSSACSKSAADYLERGNKYFGEKKYKEAIIEFRNATKKDPKLGEAHLKLAESYAQVGDATNSIREYIRAGDTLPNDKSVQLKAGAALLRAGRFEDAKAKAEALIKADPRNAEAQVLLGNALFGLKDLDGAVSEMEEAIQLAPKESRSYTNLGFIQAQKGNPEAAEKAFRQAVEANPQSLDAHLALGAFLMSDGRAVDAESEFKKALSIDGKSILANRLLATYYLSANRPAEAEPHLKTIADTTKAASAQLALADYYATTNRGAEALKLLEEVAKLKEPKEAFVEAKSRIAGIQYLQGQKPAAHKTIDEVIAAQPKSAKALLLKAEFLQQENRTDEALAKAQAAVSADPKSAPAHYTLATLYAAKGKNTEAIASYSEVLKLNPRAALAQVQLSRLQLAEGKVDSAVQYAEQAVSSAPDNPVARLLLARGLIVKGENARAESELKALVAKYPNNPAALAQYGLVLTLKRDLTGARQAYEKAFTLDPATTEALAGLVTLDLAAKKPADARKRVEARLAGAPRDPGVLVLAARTYATTGDLAAAERALLTTIEVAPDSLQAYGLLGQLYLQQQKLDQARQKFEQLAAKQPKPVGAKTMIGMILQMQGKNADAQKAYEKVMELDPRAGVAANNLAWLYSEGGGSLDQALQLAQTAKAARDLTESPEVSDTLGWIYYKKGLASQAVAALQEAVTRDPKNAVYQYHLGMALTKAGQAQAGREALQKALALNPNFDGAADARKAMAETK